MSEPVLRRQRRTKIDGTALFQQATAVAGLMAGWAKVAENAGAAGGDGTSIARFAQSLETRLVSLSHTLRSGSYTPGPLRRVDIPKPAGGLRRLSIPCVVDRIAQSSIARLLSPELEEEFEDASCGYRPGRGVADAVRRVEALRRQGFVYTLDADIEGYFDNVPIDRLMDRLSQSITEGPLLALIGLWLEHGAVLGRGLAQGAPLSPLLANLYLDRLDEALSRQGLRIVRYADDFLVLAKDKTAIEAAHRRTTELLQEAGLSLNLQKTAIRDYDATIRFLGYAFVRGFALPSAEEGDTVERALAQVADADRAAEAEASALAKGEAQEASGGYHLGLRVLHVRQRGRRLGLRNEAFSVRASASEGADGAHGTEPRELLAVHASRVDRIEVGPGVDVDLPALKLAMAHEVPVAFVNGHGRTLAQLARPLEPRAGRHLAQARLVLDPPARLDLARRIVSGRIANQRSLLRRVNHRRGVASVARACVALSGLDRRARHASDLDRLRGYEGAATKLYWRAFSALLLDGFTLSARRRRVGHDPVNIALDMTAGLLLRDMDAIVTAAGLHPGFGVLHGTNDYHDACVYDLVEEFRAGLVESVVLHAFNTRQLGAAHFSRLNDSAWHMERMGGDILIRAYEARAERPILLPRLGRRMSWRQVMLHQAEHFAAHVEGHAIYTPYVLDN